MFKPLRVFREGDVLSARTLNALRDAIVRQKLHAGLDSGVELKEGPEGTVIRILDDTSTSESFDLWCQLGASLGPATGTWPTITATTTTADVYQGSGTGLVKVDTAATIYNRFPVSWAANKTTALVPAADGTGYVIIEQSC